jgi:proline iminopeptidase
MTPDAYTNQELLLDVGNGHQIYVQDWGKKDAKTPIVFLHGGPGYGLKDSHRQRFDPTKQRVIFFDQRGVGKSTPLGSIEHNTTQDLVEDIEKIAAKLQLEKFIITGGSWGSTLAFTYAITHPERVKAMVLTGIFTGTKAEIKYVDSGGYRTHFPDVWEKLLARTPAEHHDDPAKYHYENMEGSLVSLDDRFMERPFEDFEAKDIRIEAHYLSRSCFIPENYIQDNANKLTMPIWIVQGRYDFVCPPQTAYDLHKNLPNSELIWTQAGHGNDRNTYEVVRSLLLQISKED